MESELERFHKRNTTLVLNIDVLRQKLKATEKEMHMERQKVKKKKENSRIKQVTPTDTSRICFNRYEQRLEIEIGYER